MTVTCCHPRRARAGRPADLAGRRMTGTVWTALAAGLVLLVGACGTSRPDIGSAKGCPEVGILADAAKIVKFRPGGGQDLTDQLYKAEIETVGLGCDERRDEIVLTLNVAMNAELGPASAGDRRHALRFFVAVLRGKEGIVKKIYRVPADFPPSSRFATIIRQIEDLSVPVEGNAAPESFEVLVGFDLLDEEINYNRSQPGFL